MSSGFFRGLFTAVNQIFSQEKHTMPAIGDKISLEDPIKENYDLAKFGAKVAKQSNTINEVHITTSDSKKNVKMTGTKKLNRYRERLKWQ